MKVISSASNIDKAKWNDFVRNHPDGNVYQTYDIYKVYLADAKYRPLIIVYMDSKNNINGLLLAVIQKEYKGILGYLSSRSIISGGPLVKGNNIVVLDALLKEYTRLINNNAIYSQFRCFKYQSWEKNIFKNKGFLFEEHLNILLDLSVGPDQLWKNFSRSRKKGIKKALKSDFHFSLSTEPMAINEFYKLLQTSYSRIKLPYPSKEHFLNIQKLFPPSMYKIFTMSLDGQPVISMFGLFFKDVLYGYYMGLTDNVEIINKKPSDLFFWELFQWAEGNDVKIFDWMGAGKPDSTYGVRDFKLQFGGETQSFGRYEKKHARLIYSFSAFGYSLWSKVKFPKR